MYNIKWIPVENLSQQYSQIKEIKALSLSLVCENDGFSVFPLPQKNIFYVVNSCLLFIP